MYFLDESNASIYVHLGAVWIRRLRFTFAFLFSLSLLFFFFFWLRTRLGGTMVTVHATIHEH